MGLYLDPEYGIFADSDLFEYEAPYAPEYRRGFIHLRAPVQTGFTRLSLGERKPTPTFKKGSLVGIAFTDSPYLISQDRAGYYFCEAGNGMRYAAKEHDVLIKKLPTK